MRIKAAAVFGATCLVALSCAGCFNYEQETYLNDDLSGRTEIRLYPNPKPLLTAVIRKMDTSPEIKDTMEEAVDKSTYKMNIKEDSFHGIVNKDQTKNGKFSRSEKDGVNYFSFMTEFDDIRKLYEGKRKVSVTEEARGLVTYAEYFYQPAPGNEGDKKTDEDRQIFKGCYFKYVLHMPRDIVSANTDKINGNTATWELPLETAAGDKDFHITATMKAEGRIARWMRRFRKK